MDLKFRKSNGPPFPGSQTPNSNPNLSYENVVNLEEITLRQLEEDIQAYRHDLDFCHSQLAQPDLTPQETRTLQLRMLDLSHQTRACRHRIEITQFHSRIGKRSAPETIKTGPPPKRHKKALGSVDLSTPVPAQDDESTLSEPPPPSSPTATPDPAGTTSSNTAFRRLGYWDCRLCTSMKFILAGEGRTPSAPCKWPLKDVSKMMTHFLDMHAEQDAAERCAELGDALDRNRGPFEYWLRRSKGLDCGDGGVVEECIRTLRGGGVPEVFRRLHRAAAGFKG